MRDIRVIGWIAVSAVAALFACVTAAQGDEGTQRAMIAKWAGSDDTDAFLRLPAVHAELQKLLGEELNHLKHNLKVRGAVDLIHGTLSLSGNAPHQGTEEEAVVCVVPFNMTVEAAILCKSAVTVFARTERYEGATLCIKDWITLANSGHIGRIEQPANVRVVSPRVESP